MNARAPALALLVLLSTVGTAAFVPGTASANVEVAITNVTVTPERPAPGDTVTVTATVENLQSSSGSFDVEAVALRSSGRGLEEYARSGNFGTIAAGSSLSLPLTTSFDEPGLYSLRLVVYGDGAGPAQVEYPVTISVREQGPRLSLDAEEPVAGAETDVNVTVANGLSYSLRNVELTVSDDDETRRRVAAQLPAGTSEAYSLPVTPDAPGEEVVTARLRYETPEGWARSVSRSLTLDAAPLRRALDLSATAVGEGRTRALRATLANRGNAPVENVTLRAESENATITAATVERVPAGERRSARLNVSELDGSGRFPATVTATYDSAGESREASASAAVVARPGRIQLTGLDVEREGGSYHVVGSASNRGLTAVDGVVVSVLRGEDVEPAYPGREYFVGTVPESDFVSFDVYADAGPNATAVPLEVSYLVDGREITRRTEAPLPGAAAGSAGGSGGAGGASGGSGGGGPGLLGPLAIGIVAVLVAGGFSYVAWRNYRGGA
jgi:hypothetical protein